MKNLILKLVIAISIALGTAAFAMAESSQPTKGYVPDDAFESGRINVDKVPDYFVVYSRDGEVAGYIRKTDYFAPAEQRPKRIEVVDETLSTAVGHMVIGRGFVPLGTADEEIPKFETRPMTPEEIEELRRSHQ